MRVVTPPSRGAAARVPAGDGAPLDAGADGTGDAAGGPHQPTGPFRSTEIPFLAGAGSPPGGGVVRNGPADKTLQAYHPLPEGLFFHVRPSCAGTFHSSRITKGSLRAFPNDRPNTNILSLLPPELPLPLVTASHVSKLHADLWLSKEDKSSLKMQMSILFPQTLGFG